MPGDRRRSSSGWLLAGHVRRVRLRGVACAEPLLPLDLFRNQIFTAAFLASFFIGPLLLGLGVYLPLYRAGCAATVGDQSGAVITPLTLGVVVTNILGGQISRAPATTSASPSSAWRSWR